MSSILKKSVAAFTLLYLIAGCSTTKHQYSSSKAANFPEVINNKTYVVENARLSPDELAEVNTSAEKLLKSKKCLMCMLTYVNLKNASLNNADITGSHLGSADLSHISLSDAELVNVTMIRANLTQANLSYSRMNGAIFLDADLRGANLRNADLRGADFTYADLEGADLTNADLTGANFRGAIRPNGSRIPDIDCSALFC